MRQGLLMVRYFMNLLRLFGQRITFVQLWKSFDFLFNIIPQGGELFCVI